MTLEQFAKRVLAECVEKARAAGLPLPVITLDFTLRGRRRAGLCCHGDSGGSTLRFNRDYFAVQGDVYASTVAHEYAHAIVFAGLYQHRWLRERSHGLRWASVMRILGYPPHRTVQAHEAAPPKARRTRRFEYRCPACGHVSLFTSRNHSVQRAADEHNSPAGFYHQASRCGGTGSRRYQFTGKQFLA